MSLTATVKSDGSVDLITVQGKTWKMELTVTDNNDNPINITGWQVRGQIRKTYKSTEKTADWVCIITDGANGKVTVSLPATTTANIPCGATINEPASQYVYDIEAEDTNGDVVELMRGKLFVKYEVTK